MKTPAIMSCPFCGNYPYIEAFPPEKYKKNYIYILRCQNCGATKHGCETTDLQHSSQEAVKYIIDSWNQRT